MKIKKQDLKNEIRKELTLLKNKNNNLDLFTKKSLVDAIYLYLVTNDSNTSITLYDLIITTIDLLYTNESLLKISNDLIKLRCRFFKTFKIDIVE